MSDRGNYLQKIVHRGLKGKRQFKMAADTSDPRGVRSWRRLADVSTIEACDDRVRKHSRRSVSPILKGTFPSDIKKVFVSAWLGLCSLIPWRCVKNRKVKTVRDHQVSRRVWVCKLFIHFFIFLFFVAKIFGT